MTFKELKLLLENRGRYFVDKEQEGITIRTAKEYEIAWISNTQTHTLNTNYWTTYEDERFLEDNWKIISEYVGTPIKARKIDHEEVFLDIEEHNNIVHNVQSCIDSYLEGTYPYEWPILLEGIKEAVDKLKIEREEE